MTVDADTGAPLMLAYMNEESLKKTLATGEAVYWSRSRKKLWHKGETSGEIQEVIEMSTDCDQDAIVLRVKQRGGGCCHTKRPTCFYRVIADADAESGVRLVMK
jgi:phosphoribosyl-AMP cyclohydrolase